MFSKIAVLMPRQDATNSGRYNELDAIRIMEKYYNIRITEYKWYKDYPVDIWVVLTAYVKYEKKKDKCDVK
ncbi:hypothetical protein [Lactobacillus taiwanensis]|uniref:hypothetical protein n=1 Tax=Lactobacillus taiwanensis TaxID=508451 RepID=UPI00272A88F3|nr:hypothetical protein [Lactobacillus taiwanensis]